MIFIKKMKKLIQNEVVFREAKRRRRQVTRKQFSIYGTRICLLMLPRKEIWKIWNGYKKINFHLMKRHLVARFKM